MDRPCQLIPIASTRACEIWLCEDCNTVHISIGPVSMRLKLSHFLGMASTVQEAAWQIRAIKNDVTTYNTAAEYKRQH